MVGVGRLAAPPLMVIGSIRSGKFLVLGVADSPDDLVPAASVSWDTIRLGRAGERAGICEAPSELNRGAGLSAAAGPRSDEARLGGGDASEILMVDGDGVCLDRVFAVGNFVGNGELGDGTRATAAAAAPAAVGTESAIFAVALSCESRRSGLFAPSLTSALVADSRLVGCEERGAPPYDSRLCAEERETNLGLGSATTRGICPPFFNQHVYDLQMKTYIPAQWNFDECWCPEDLRLLLMLEQRRDEASSAGGLHFWASEGSFRWERG